jgi:hypothetical protein
MGSRRWACSVGWMASLLDTSAQLEKIHDCIVEGGGSFAVLEHKLAKINLAG